MKEEEAASSLDDEVVHFIGLVPVSHLNGLVQLFENEFDLCKGEESGGWILYRSEELKKLKEKQRLEEEDEY